MRFFDTGPKVRGVLLRPHNTPWSAVHNRPRFFILARHGLHAAWDCVGFSQTGTFTVRGRVTDASTGEYVLGANVIVDGQSQGASTNIYGFYSLTLPKALRP